LKKDVLRCQNDSDVGRLEPPPMLRLPIDVATLSALLALLPDAFALGGLGLDATVERLALLVLVALMAHRAALGLEARRLTKDADLLIGAALRGRIDAL
jgi:hypothetical protein